MKILLIVTLSVSLLANVWWWRKSSAKPEGNETPSAMRGSAHATATAAGTFRASSEETSATRATALLVSTAGAVEKALVTGDVAALRDELIAAGVDHQTQRALVDGVLWRRYQQEIAARRIEGQRAAWWRGGVVSDGTPPPTLWTHVNRPVRATLGINPIDVAEVQLRYAFLPPEKQQVLAKIDLDYGEMRANASLSRSQLEEFRLLAAEREKDVVAALSPEERAEYELRFTNSPGTAARFAAMDATEAEARAIKPVINALLQQAAAIPPGDSTTRAARSEPEQRTLDELVAKIGYERTLDYWWAAPTGPYVPTVQLMRELNLPPSRASELLQLAAETGVRGSAIHHDPSLTTEQKHCALDPRKHDDCGAGV